MIAWLAAYVGKPFATWFVDAMAKYVQGELRAWKAKRDTKDMRDKVFNQLENAQTLEETDAALKGLDDAWTGIRR